MTTTTTVQLGIRAMNATGRVLRRLGVQPVSLEIDRLLTDARRRTRLDDFGGEEFRAPLAIILEGLAKEARLSWLGRIAARADLTSLLAQRLRLVHERARHPEIAAERIARPLFIVGLPRTGSTLLHHLLAQDPASRVAQAWEVMVPSPPPERATYATDPRIAEAARRLRWFDRIAPEFRTIHPLGAQLALECIALMASSFLSPRFHTTYWLPTYQAWLEEQDPRPAYETHRRVLQHLQWRAPGERWVLKAPSHLWSLEALFATYPDAVVVQTHRDPLVVLPSVASLTAVLQGAFAERVDLAEIGREVTHRWSEGLDRALAFRRREGTAAGRFVDVHYRDLLRDPIAVIREIHARFDMPLGAAAEQRMRAHLAGNPQGKHGAHRYTLATFGLDAAAIKHRFKPYAEYFGIEQEHHER